MCLILKPSHRALATIGAPTRGRAPLEGAPRRRLALAMLPLAGLTLTSVAQAGPNDLYGFGAPAIGRGGGGVAIVDDPAGVFLNPAALVRMPEPKAMVGYSLLRMRLAALPAVRWDTNQDGVVDDTDEPLQLDPNPQPADGFSVAIGKPIRERFGIALAAFAPSRSLLRIHTFEPALPSWFMLENSAQRFELALGFGWEQFRGVRVGGAVEMIARSRYTLRLTMDVPVHGAADDDETLGELVGPITLDPHEMELDVSPALAPLAGVQWDVGELLPALDGLQMGLTYRGAVGLPVEVDVELQGNFRAEEVGDLDPLVYTLVAPIGLDVFDHYLPEQWTGGVAWEAPAWRAYVDVRRTGWDRMRLNVATVVNSEVQSQIITLSDPTIHDGNPYTIRLQPTWSTRAGGEVELSRREVGARFGELAFTGRAGGGFEPTPLVSQGSGTAFLDADRLIGTVGIGVSHEDPFAITEGRVAWDTFFEYQKIASGDLQPGGDPDRAGAPVDGAAIPIGGHLWAAGLQWSFEY